MSGENKVVRQPVQKTQSLKPDYPSGGKDLRANYDIDKASARCVGRKKDAKVFLASSKFNAEHQVAIKVFSKEKLRARGAASYGAILNEVEALKKLDHPNIVTYYESYSDEKHVYLVMELVRGEDFFDKI